MDVIEGSVLGGSAVSNGFAGGGRVAVLEAPAPRRAPARQSPPRRLAEKPVPPTVPARRQEKLAPLAPPTSDRIATLDAVRLLASAAVIWVHSAPVGSQAGVYGTFSTPFFTIVAIFLLLRSQHKNPDKSFSAYAWSRLGRLYLPFLAWSVIYLVARNVERLLRGETPLLRPQLSDLLGGTSMQLWFLPFILLAGLAVFPAGRYLARRPHGGMGLALACAAGGVAWALAPKPDFMLCGNLSHFAERSWEHAPAIGLGVAFYVLLSRKTPNLRAPPALAAAGLVVALLCLASFVVVGYNTLAKNLAGVGLMLFVSCPLPWRWVRHAGAVGAYSVGIYFIHPLLTVPAREMVAHCVPHDGRLLLASVAVMGAGYFGSMIATIALRRDRRTRWLVA